MWGIPGTDMIDSFLNPGKGYKDASKELEKAWNEAKQYQQPYQQAGVDQLGRLTGAEDALLDPTKLLADWMSSYETSPYAQKSMENATASGLDAASSMGLMGSSAAINNVQNSAGYIMDQDRNQYLDDLMKKYMAGIGVGQNIYNTGAATAGQMGNQVMGYGQGMGQAAYGQQAAGGNQFMNLAAMAAMLSML